MSAPPTANPRRAGAAERLWQEVVLRGPAPPSVRERFVVFEFFAGHAGLSAAAAVRGALTFPIDHGGNAHTPLVPTVALDLTDPAAQEAAFGMMRAARVGFVWLAPPCGTFSRARDRPLPAAAVRAGARAAAPLRSDEFVAGLPGLRGTDQDRVIAGNALAAFAARVAAWCSQADVPFALENPASSRMWQLPALAALAALPGAAAVEFHHCMFGGRRAKHTRLITNCGALRALSAFCDGSHDHAPWAAFDATGYWRFGTAEEAEYPAALCKAAAALIVPPAAAPRSPAEVVLTRRSRRPGRGGLAADLAAAVGRQPRGKQEPLIPEFPEPPSRLETRTGGEVPEPAGELTPWTPQGFLTRSFSVAHPVDRPFDVDDGTRAAIQFWTERDLETNQNEVEGTFARWEARAAELMSDEAALHDKLPEATAQVLVGKRLCILQELADEIGHPDKTIVAELAGGFALAGALPASGVYPPRPPERAIVGHPTSWLDVCAPAVQTNLRHTLARSPLSPDILPEVAAATAKEVEVGWARGPLTEAEIAEACGPFWVPARRFGVRQGPKVRPIDDLARSLVNSATSVADLVVPDGVDVTIAISRAWAEAARAADPRTGLRGADLGGKTFDLEAAYKQCAVRVDHKRLAVFAYAAPGADGRYLYLASALPFGATASVPHFNRVARLLREILTRGARVTTSHFFDDFPVVGPRPLWDTFGRAVVRLGALVGWRWKPATVETAFDRSFGLLGVRLDLRRAVCEGAVVVTNTEARQAELAEALAAARAEPRMEPHAAAVLAGRLAFAGSQCFGKSGAAFLAPLRETARRTTAAPMAGKLAAALDWWRAFVFHAAPRELRLFVPTLPLLLFGDGCCEENLHGIGAAIFDQGTGHHEYFGMKVWPRVSRLLVDGVGSQQIIGQLELLPILVALWVWKARFCEPGRRVIAFVDNDAARYGIIRGYSPREVSRLIIEGFWHEAAALQIAPWLARVPTDGNPADAASRLDHAAMQALRPAPRRVADPACERELVAVLERGGGGHEFRPGQSSGPRSENRGAPPRRDATFPKSHRIGVGA